MKPTNIEQLRDQLLDVFLETRAGTTKHYVAKETTNTAGKILGSIKLELEYAAMRGEKPEIAFLDGATQAQKLLPNKAPKS
jgi:hypothetical protein